MHFTPFKLYTPNGRLGHFRFLIWREEEEFLLVLHSDDTHLRQSCAHKKVSKCPHCHLFLCNRYMDDHSSDLPNDELELCCIVVTCTLQSLLFMQSKADSATEFDKEAYIFNTPRLAS